MCICIEEQEEEGNCIQFKSVPCLHIPATWWQCATAAIVVWTVQSLCEQYNHCHDWELYLLL